MRSLKKSELVLILILTAILTNGRGLAGSSAAAHTRIQQDLIPQTGNAGALDLTFGKGGKAIAEVSGAKAFGDALAVQPDGKLIEAGFIVTAAGFSSEDSLVARFNPDGTLDATFGSGGLVSTDFSGQANVAAAVAVQTDGRIVTAGHAITGLGNFALARYNTDGSLDTTFGTGGKVFTDAQGNDENATSLAILPDGRLLVGGDTADPSEISSDFKLVRYNASGSLDTTFGSGGTVVTDFFGHINHLFAIAIESDGKILATGSAALDANQEVSDFALVRYNADGSLDGSFGAGGKVTTHFSGRGDSASAIAISKAGKIILAGSAGGNIPARSFDLSDFALARYNPDGSLDMSFGAGGKVTTDFAGNFDRARGLALQADDKILAGGFMQTTNDSGTEAFALARYNIDGSPDLNFGSAGKTTTAFSGLGDSAAAIVLQNDGKAVLGGFSVQPTGPDTAGVAMALARYTTESSGFSLSFDQPSVTGDRGSVVKVQVIVNRTGGHAGDVTITPPDGSGIGIKVKPTVPQSTTDNTATFKLKIKEGANVGQSTLTFTGADSSGHTSAATLTVIIQ